MCAGGKGTGGSNGVVGNRDERGKKGGKPQQQAAAQRTTMGGYNSSDDEQQGGEDEGLGDDGRGLGKASTPPEYRFLSAGRRSLMDYLLSTSSGAASSGGKDAAAAEAEAAADVPIEPAPEEPPAAVDGESVADSASFERIGTYVA